MKETGQSGTKRIEERQYCNLLASLVFFSDRLPELPEVMGLSDRIAVMRAGKVVGVFNSAEASEEQIVAYAVGTSAIEQ